MRHRHVYICISFLVSFMLGWLVYAWYENRAYDPSETLFVYGTLQSPTVRFLVCQCHTPSTPAVLSDYQMHDRTIHPAPGSTVAGQLLHVTPVELARFDRYERTPHYYYRSQIEVNGTTAWVYRRRE